MGLKIKWTEFAVQQTKDIFDYFEKNAGKRIARKIVIGIVDSTLKLSDQPKIGQMEELLIYRPQKFRYLVHTNYKMIYWVNEDKKFIEIVDVFDTRQNPIKMKRNK